MPAVLMFITKSTFARSVEAQLLELTCLSGQVLMLSNSCMQIVPVQICATRQLPYILPVCCRDELLHKHELAGRVKAEAAQQHLQCFCVKVSCRPRVLHLVGQYCSSHYLPSAGHTVFHF